MKNKIIGLLIIVVAILAGGLGVYGLVESNTKRTTTGSMTPEAILEISEFSSLEFRYTDVISILEEKEFKIFGFDINPQESILIVQYEGIIKLGIDSKEMTITELEKVDGEKTKVEIKLPQIKVISSETPLDSFEIIVNKGVFTSKKIDMQVFFDEASARQHLHNEEALNAYSLSAKESAQKQLESLFRQFGLLEEYEIVWVD